MGQKSGETEFADFMKRLNNSWEKAEIDGHKFADFLKELNNSCQKADFAKKDDVFGQKSGEIEAGEPPFWWHKAFAKDLKNLWQKPEFAQKAEIDGQKSGEIEVPKPSSWWPVAEFAQKAEIFGQIPSKFEAGKPSFSSPKADFRVKKRKHKKHGVGVHKKLKKSGEVESPSSWWPVAEFAHNAETFGQKSGEIEAGKPSFPWKKADFAERAVIFGQKSGEIEAAKPSFWWPLGELAHKAEIFGQKSGEIEAGKPSFSWQKVDFAQKSEIETGKPSFSWQKGDFAQKAEIDGLKSGETETGKPSFSWQYIDFVQKPDFLGQKSGEIELGKPSFSWQKTGEIEAWNHLFPGFIQKLKNKWQKAASAQKAETDGQKSGETEAGLPSVSSFSWPKACPLGLLAKQKAEIERQKCVFSQQKSDNFEFWMPEVGLSIEFVKEKHYLKWGGVHRKDKFPTWKLLKRGEPNLEEPWLSGSVKVGNENLAWEYSKIGELEEKEKIILLEECDWVCGEDGGTSTKFISREPRPHGPKKKLLRREIRRVYENVKGKKLLKWQTNRLFAVDSDYESDTDEAKRWPISEVVELESKRDYYDLIYGNPDKKGDETGKNQKRRRMVTHGTNNNLHCGYLNKRKKKEKGRSHVVYDVDPPKSPAYGLSEEFHVETHPDLQLQEGDTESESDEEINRRCRYFNQVRTDKYFCDPKGETLPPVPPELQDEYNRQLAQSGGFDFSSDLDPRIFHKAPIHPVRVSNPEFVKDSKRAIDMFNKDNGTTYAFETVLTVNQAFGSTFYITFQAKSAVSGYLETFQTASQTNINGGRDVVMCRIKRQFTAASGASGTFQTAAHSVETS